MKKINSKKGELLVETIVAMAVFAIMTVASFSAYKTFSLVGKKESDYIFFESLCLNIDKYYDNYGKDYWAQEFFGSNYPNLDRYGQRYDSSYNPVAANNPIYDYELTISYNGNNLIVNIWNVKTESWIVHNLDYGPSLATTKKDKDYYNDILTYNVGIKQLKPEDDDPTNDDLEDITVIENE